MKSDNVGDENMIEYKWSYREITDSSRNGNTAIFDSLDIQLEELSKGELSIQMRKMVVRKRMKTYQKK